MTRFLLAAPSATVIALSSLLATAPACLAADDELPVDSDQLEAMTLNAMTLNAMTLNALATVPATNWSLPRFALSDATYRWGTSYNQRILREALAEPMSQVFMRYLAGCALPAGTSFTWRNTINGEEVTFHGAIGLCPQWATGAADLGCQERVSACLLARNNAYGTEVQISLRGRGLGDGNLPLASQVRGGGEAASLDACASRTYGFADCGWDAGYVGSCEPGDVVTVHTDAASCTGYPMVRVCAGDVACDGDSTHRVAQRSFACHTGDFTFTCPLRYDRSQHESTFTIMTRPFYSDIAAYARFSVAASDSDHDGVSSAVYPESERHLYDFREGAFYGNLFDYQQLGITSTVRYDVEFGVAYLTYHVAGHDYPTAAAAAAAARDAGVVVYREMYACQSDEWTEDSAMRMYRVCAGNTPDQRLCAANWMGRCAPAGTCAVDHSPTATWEGDYDDCRGGVSWRYQSGYWTPVFKVWGNPITTYLSEECDWCGELF